MVDLQAALYATHARSSSDQSKGTKRSRSQSAAANRTNPAKDDVGQNEDEEDYLRMEHLRRKADLYARLQSGESVSEKIDAACLVDFDAKDATSRRVAQTDRAHTSLEPFPSSAQGFVRAAESSLGHGGARPPVDGTETAALRQAAAQQKSKRARALSDRRALIRQRCGY